MTKEPTSLEAAPEVTLRPVTAKDEAFLFKVYRSTRAEEMAMTGWLDVEQRAFLKMQFQLQRDSYRQQYPNAQHVIILAAGQPAGRMMVDRTQADELRGVDIAILPEFRNAGVGSFLIKSLLDEATAAGIPFRIQVERFNHKALRLYERLSFSYLDETDTHIAMEWSMKRAPSKNRSATQKKHVKAK
jgi:GNAT superfamily N-acetyltransferase